MPPLLIGRSVQGVGSTLSWVAALALVSDLARPGRKGEAIGFALAANSLGAIGGPALGGIVGGEISFEAPFLLVSVIAAMIFTLGWIVLPRAVPFAGRSPARSAASARSCGAARRCRPPLRSSGPERSAWSISSSPSISIGAWARSATTIGLLFAAVALVDAATSPLAGRAGDRLGRRPVAFAGAAVMGASGLLLAALGGFTGAAVALGILAFGICITFAAAIPWLDETFGELDRGLAYGGLNLVYALGYTIGPLLGGWMLGHSGADSAYVMIAATSIALASALALSWWRHARVRGEYEVHDRRLSVSGGCAKRQGLLILSAARRVLRRRTA